MTTCCGDYHYADCPITAPAYEPDPYDDDRDPGPDPGDIGPFEGCCRQGDWSGNRHQPVSAYVYVVRVYPRAGWNAWSARTSFVPETTDEYRWQCDYCGRVGTRAELEA